MEFEDEQNHLKDVMTSIAFAREFTQARQPKVVQEAIAGVPWNEISVPSIVFFLSNTNQLFTHRSWILAYYIHIELPRRLDSSILAKVLAFLHELKHPPHWLFLMNLQRPDVMMSAFVPVESVARARHLWRLTKSAAHCMNFGYKSLQSCMIASNVSEEDMIAAAREKCAAKTLLSVRDNISAILVSKLLTYEAFTYLRLLMEEKRITASTVTACHAFYHVIYTENSCDLFLTQTMLPHFDPRQFWSLSFVIYLMNRKTTKAIASVGAWPVIVEKFHPLGLFLPNEQILKNSELFMGYITMMRSAPPEAMAPIDNQGTPYQIILKFLETHGAYIKKRAHIKRTAERYLSPDAVKNRIARRQSALASAAIDQ